MQCWLWLQLENELHTAQSRVAQVTEDKNRMEDRLSAVEAAHCLAQDQAAQLQVSVKWLLGDRGENVIFTGHFFEMKIIMVA